MEKEKKITIIIIRRKETINILQKSLPSNPNPNPNKDAQNGAKKEKKIPTF